MMFSPGSYYHRHCFTVILIKKKFWLNTLIQFAISRICLEIRKNDANVQINNIIVWFLFPFCVSMCVCYRSNIAWVQLTMSSALLSRPTVWPIFVKYADGSMDMTLVWCFHVLTNDPSCYMMPCGVVKVVKLTHY